MKENLKNIIEKEISQSDENIAFYFNDLNGNEIKINCKEEFEAASCLKVFILLEVLKQVNENKLTLTDKIVYKKDDYTEGSGILRNLTPGLEFSIEDLLTLTIVLSDNIAANMLIDLVSIDSINKTIRECGLTNSVIHNKFGFYSDKLCSMTAEDYGKIFEKILNNHLISNEISKQMLSFLKKQQSYQMLMTKSMNEQRINKYFKENNNEQGIIKYVASKSGKWKSSRNDGGIISTIYGDYILVILIKGFDDENFLNDKVCKTGTLISEIIFNNYIKNNKNEN
jgi:Beta-lactamase class A